MAIHLVQRSVAYSACRRSAGEDDIIVLLGEGTAAVLSQAITEGTGEALVLEQDAHQRGLRGHVPEGIQSINDDQLVALCALHAPVISWTRP